MTFLHAPHALLPDGWAADVRVEIAADGSIAAVAAGQPRQPGDTALDTPLLPAPTNLHSHTFQRAMAGLTECAIGGSEDFWSWRRLMYRFLDRMTPADIEAVAAWAFVEMLEGGFAACAEFHYLHHQPGGGSYDDPAETGGRICAAARAAGIGLTLLPVLYQRAGLDEASVAGGQLRFGCDRDRFVRLLDATRAHLQADGADPISLGVAPHSLRAVAPADVAWAAGLLPDGPVHIHVAEQVAEVAEVTAALGRRPVETLLDLGADARWCLIHATHMTDAETAALAASGAVAGLCPVTEANLGDGVFPAAAFLAAGGRLGIGSDSNICIDVGGELRLLEYGQRLTRRARAVLADDGSVGQALWMATCRGGAQAAGRRAGAIAPGLRADLLTLQAAPGVAAMPPAERLDHAIFAAPRLPVDRLWVAGRRAVEQGRALARDALRAPFERTMAQLLAAL
ncbi:MAG: formimidoylglutamate deiminase [Pseudomonadota bacterium]